MRDLLIAGDAMKAGPSTRFAGVRDDSRVIGLRLRVMLLQALW